MNKKEIPFIYAMDTNELKKKPRSNNDIPELARGITFKMGEKTS